MSDVPLFALHESLRWREGPNRPPEDLGRSYRVTLNLLVCRRTMYMYYTGPLQGYLAHEKQRPPRHSRTVSGRARLGRERKNYWARTEIIIGREPKSLMYRGTSLIKTPPSYPPLGPP
jgi:hypothetical protein